MSSNCGTTLILPLSLTADLWDGSLSLLCSRLGGRTKGITRPRPSQRRFPLSWTLPNPAKIFEPTHAREHLLLCITMRHAHKRPAPVLWLVNGSRESAGLEMWQLRRALDMQASAMWLIFAAQLCRAIAARLASERKKKERNRKNKSPPFIFPLVLLITCGPASGVSPLSPLLSAHGYTALNCYFGKDITAINSNYVCCNQMDDLTVMRETVQRYSQLMPALRIERVEDEWREGKKSSNS